MVETYKYWNKLIKRHHQYWKLQEIRAVNATKVAFACTGTGIE